jgi:aminopeptidase YwaD
MSGSTGGTVSAPAVFVGLADETGIGGRSLAGKVAVSDRGTLTFQQKYDAVKAAGAVGLIVVNNVDGVFVGNIYKRAEMPVVGVTTSDGAALKKAADTGQTVSITAPESEQSTAKNVLARPAKGAKCEILVGGHYDTVPGARGALDNASGTAATLELARAFAADGLDAGLCFATFSAEESGLFGSAALVKQMQDAGQLPRYMVNLDMTGLGTRVDLFGSPELTQQAAGLADKMGIDAAPADLGITFGSDHQSFQKAGVPVIFFASNELGKFHTPGDVVSEIQLDSLERVGDLAFAYIGELLKTIARG